MAGFLRIDKPSTGGLLDLKTDVEIKAEVSGITSIHRIIIDVRANIIGGIEAPKAEVYVHGGRFSKVNVMGSIVARKVDLKHAEVDGHILANGIKISDTVVNGPVRAKVRFL